uniref:Zinc finger BED domaincontaining protein 1like [Maylandia zebra] n=1 Tax=Lepeophtheirus salmonis TaxID=72036 RepID=A0A0K2TA40_LEPSM
MSAEEICPNGTIGSDLMPKYKSTSAIWGYFGFHRDDINQSMVLCKTCMTKIATKQSSTTNMFHHLKHHHPELHDECIALREIQGATTSQSSQKKRTRSLITISSCATTPPNESSSTRNKDITEGIAFHLAKDMVPINTVSKEGFKKMVHTLDKSYKIPPPSYFYQVAIPKLFNKCKMDVAITVREIDFFAITIDHWSSRTIEIYISLTVHFVTKNFDMKTCCLQTFFLPQEQYPENNIAEQIRGALEEWDLEEDQQVCVTTDNASNMINALELYGRMHLQCFMHMLHMAIENAVKSDSRINSAISGCNKLVSYFSLSLSKRRALEQVQQRLNLPVHGLITECCTRWGTRVHMINRILEQEKALHEVLSEDKDTKYLILGHHDLNVLESVCKVLEPLLEFTDALSGEGYVCVSHIKPVLNLFHSTILAKEEGDTDITSSLKKKIWKFINDKYEDKVIQELLDVSSFLDPRYKTQYISDCDIPIVKARLVSEMKSMHSTACMRVEELSQPPTKKAKKSLASFFKRTTTSASMTIDPTNAIESELSVYMQSSTIDTEENPLLWWRIQKINFPRLSIMARKYLCVQATSSPSERILSTSENIVSDEKSCLNPDMVNKLAFLAKNM